jgi:hypothetical protein
MNASLAGKSYWILGLIVTSSVLEFSMSPKISAGFTEVFLTKI